MDRTIPFFTERIVPEAIDQGKRVLISSSENAIRGLLMHLCEIPEDKITELEIPNGLPLVFDLRSKCVKLLDDGTGRDPLEVHNFGKAASYLFRPCEDEDGNPDEECDIRFATDERFVLTNDDHATIAAIKKQIVSRNEAVLAE
jgi:2,3-bisphosphoglycerate-dependent phosphoglycerate mutase